MQAIDMVLVVMLTWSCVTMNYVFASAVGVVLSSKGVLLIVVLPIVYLYYAIYRFIRRPFVDLQRLESVSRSPLYTTFSEQLNGLSVVRAFQKQQFFEEHHREMLNRNLAPFFFSRTAVPAWLSLRLACMGALVMFSVGVVAIVLPDMSSAGTTGLGLTYSMQIAHMMMIAVFVVTTVETQMVAVERLMTYCDELEHEAPEIIEETAPPASWPEHGHIEIAGLVMGYHEGPDVLHSLDAVIESGEKIGVVGRTGSGKSTLLLSMFRLVEARRGTITIDGVNIFTIGVQQLRSKLGIIPQDPVLFVGDMKYNLDPFGKCTDEELWTALEQVKMKELVEGLSGGLAEPIHEYGSNFSVGQRQLICIARALLLKPRILMLDEATASIDSETDALLQHMIRTQFKSQTVITIAHRLDTIIDYNRVMVLKAGRLAEFDTPAALIDQPGGVFAEMVAAGNQSHLRQLAAAAANASNQSVSTTEAEAGAAAPHAGREVLAD